MTSYYSNEMTDEGKAKAEEARIEFTKLHVLISETFPKSRETSIALTNLEQAAMWAIKSIAVSYPASK